MVCLITSLGIEESAWPMLSIIAASRVKDMYVLIGRCEFELDLVTDVWFDDGCFAEIVSRPGQRKNVFHRRLFD